MTKPKGQAKRWLTNMLRAPIRYCEYKDPPGCAASRDSLTDPTVYAKSYQASQVYQVFARQQLDLLAKFASGDLIYLNCKEPSKSSKSFKYTCLLTTLLIPTHTSHFRCSQSSKSIWQRQLVLLLVSLPLPTCSEILSSGLSSAVW